MANPSKGTASTLSAETVGILQFDDDVEGQSSVKYAHASIYGYPAQLVKIAAGVTTSVAYPYDGDGFLDGVTDTSNIQLDNVTSGLPTDCTGMLIQMVSGTTANLGSTRRITTHASSRRMTLNRALPAIPVVGDGYRLMVDVGRLSQLLLKSEMSVSGAEVEVLPIFFDWGLGTDGNLRASISVPDSSRTISQAGLQTTYTEEASYFHGENIAISAKGTRGAKIYLISVSSGVVSLWACGV